MKKLLALFLAVVMVLSLAACSSGNNDATPAASTPQSGSTAATQPADPKGTTATYDGSKVTIRFYHTMGSNLKAVLDTYIEEFNKIYPNITVETTTIGSYDDVRNQIGTEIPVGNQPNIAYCYPDHVAMYNLAGAVQTLDEFINSTSTVQRADGTTEILGLTAEQKADFIEGYYKEGQQFGDGLMYTLPFSKSTEVLYYNKTFFEANNLSVPTTWEELEAVAKKILEIDSNPECVPLGYDSEANWFITLCEQYDSPYTSAVGDHFLFDNETNRNFVKMLHDWYQDGLLTTQGLLGGYTSNIFKEQKSYMSIGSSAGATYQRPDPAADGQYPFEVGIATIPQVDPANPKVISQGPSVCIFKKDNEQEVLASWLFVKYLTTSVDFQAEFSMASGYVPVLKSVAENEEYAKFLASADGGKYISALSAKICLEQKDYYYTSPAFNGSSEARSQVGAILTKCMPDTSSDIEAVIADAFKEAVEECQYQAR